MPSQNSAVLSIGTKQKQEDHHKRGDSRPDKGALPPDVVGEVRADQKPDQAPRICTIRKPPVLVEDKPRTVRR